jgi:large subunit ribosomal protein L32
MALPKKKVSRARRNARRSANFKIATPTLVECSHCHQLKQAHRVCPKCGYYDGKQVIAVDEKK